ncbi:MAG: class I SAM-dependent methyltransferase [Ilumatobacteraceae bacterium]
MAPTERFDADYYSRFYGRKPVHDQRRIGHLAAGVTSMAAWWRIPIRSVLDVGAGRGYWRNWLATEMPHVRYVGLDISEHACRRYSHEHADIARWKPTRTFDLVICQSVLQYIDDDDARSAIGVLSDACRGLLFVEAPTTADRAEVIDPERTDLDIHWRAGDWYRAELDRYFIEVGGGLWSHRSQPVPFFELERARRPQRVRSRVVES